MPLQTVCVRHNPGGALAGEALDRHTLRWVEAINASGRAYLTPSVLDDRWMVRGLGGGREHRAPPRRAAVAADAGRGGRLVQRAMTGGRGPGPPIEMIATDIDGTMLRSDGSLSPAVKGALHDAADAGIHVVPATGRPVLIASSDVIEALDLPDYWVFANGAITRHLGRDELIRGFWMDQETTRRLVEGVRLALPNARLRPGVRADRGLRARFRGRGADGAGRRARRRRPGRTRLDRPRLRPDPEDPGLRPVGRPGPPLPST